MNSMKTMSPLKENQYQVKQDTTELYTSLHILDWGRGGGLDGGVGARGFKPSNKSDANIKNCTEICMYIFDCQQMCINVKLEHVQIYFVEKDQ